MAGIHASTQVARCRVDWHRYHLHACNRIHVAFSAMKLEQQLYSPATGWRRNAGNLAGHHPQIIFAFGPRPILDSTDLFEAMRSMHPGAAVVLSSTAGEITNDAVSSDVVAATMVAFEATRITTAATSVRTQFESYAAGRQLAHRLRGPGFRHVLVISDGQLVNGTDLARGFNEHLPAGVTLTGGLAGDGERFDTTLVGLNEKPVSGRIAAVGFYGQQLRVGFGSSGGWTPFGTDHIATSTAGNILFKLDGQPALDLYRQHLGERAAALPAAALCFPLCVTPIGQPSVVRTILAIDQSTNSMVFAGDIPTGSHVRFMRASDADLIAGAAAAAQQARIDPVAELAICISCVGRRIVLGARTGEETASVRRVLGPEPLLAGFYSYGELAPADCETECQLHNQTMTVTTLAETPAAA